MRLVAMIATVSPGWTPSATRPAATSSAVSRICAQVSVRQPRAVDVDLVGVRRGVGELFGRVGEGVDEGASLDLGLDLLAGNENVGHGVPSHSPSDRPMISFWISVVPP